MKIFEFQFNPTVKKDRFFKAFSLENIFMVAELTNTLPQNSHFLDILVGVIKKEYEENHQSFQKTLKALNEFLEKESKRGNTDWIGNLNLALLSFSQKKNSSSQIFSLAKIGTIEIYMARHGTLTNMGSNVHDFKKFVSGGVLLDDKIIACTHELFSLCSSKNFFHDLAFFKEEKQFRELFRNKEKELSKSSGILFSVLVDEENSEDGKEALPKTKRFLPPLPHITVPKMNFSFPHINIKIPKPPQLKILGERKIALLFTFLGLLLTGFAIFNLQEDKAIGSTIQKVKVLESQNKFFEAWQTLSPLFQTRSVSSNVLDLRQTLEQKLFSINFLQDIKNPQLLYKIKQGETNLIPHGMVFGANHLYLFNPFASEIFAIDLAKKTGTVIKTKENIKAGTAFIDSAAFFENPNIFAQILPNQQLKETPLPGKQDLSVESMGSFGSNLFIFDSAKAKITKYTNIVSQESVPFQWLNAAGSKKAVGAKSFSVDGYAWLLLNGSEIQQYYAGSYVQSFKPQIFPQLSHATRLKTQFGFQYLYVLDPSEKRILLFTKEGVLTKQYRSSAFDNLIDFAVSSDEKTIYLLNGFLIFQILL